MTRLPYGGGYAHFIPNHLPGIPQFTENNFMSVFMR